MSKIISDSSPFYGIRELPDLWLVESRPQIARSHFDRRGCVRQIRASGHRSHSNVHAPGTRRNENLQKSTSYCPSVVQQPSMTNAPDHRQAYYVYNAIPATHRTGTHRPAFNTNASNTFSIVEFMVPLCCGKCEEKVKEELENTEGVYGVMCDQHNQRVAVSSTLDRDRLLKRVKRVKKNSHFWRGRNSVHHVSSLGRPSESYYNHNIIQLLNRSEIPRAYNPESSLHHQIISSQIPGRQQSNAIHCSRDLNSFEGPFDKYSQSCYISDSIDGSFYCNDHLPPCSYRLAYEYEHSDDYALSYY